MRISKSSYDEEGCGEGGPSQVWGSREMFLKFYMHICHILMLFRRRLSIDQQCQAKILEG